MLHRSSARALGLSMFAGLLLLGPEPADAAAAKVTLLDRLAAPQGSAAVSLTTGSVKLKATLAPLPATIDTGTGTFQATIYKAYLASSTDPALEIPIGSLYPTSKSKAAAALAAKGDLSALGFDRVVVVAFSKDGLSSFDVLTGEIE